MRHRIFLASIFFIALGARAQNFTVINWTTAASQPYPVYEAQGEVVNGKLYTFGGFDQQKIASGYWTPTDRAFVYDPSTNAWASILKMPPMNNTGRGGVTHAGFTTDSTNIYFAGGYTSNTTGTGQIFGTKEVWKYVVAENRYERLPDLPKALASGQLEYLNNRLHHVGGFPGNPNTTVEVADHYVLDLKNIAAGWKQLATLPAPRNHMGSACLGGKIYIVGGQRGNDDTSVPVRDGYAYNPATNTWTRIADMPVPGGTSGRAHISSSVAVLGGRLIVIGGETSHNVRTNLVSAYSPTTNTWQNLSVFPRTIAGGVAGAMNGLLYYTGGPSTAATYKGTPAQNATLIAAADAHVRNGTYSNTNYGKDTALQLKGSTSTGFTRYYYVKFTLGTVQDIYSAKLRLHGRNNETTSGVVITAYGVSNDSWVETSLTFNNAPAASTAALGTVSVNSVAKYYEIDVTAFVKSQAAGDKVVSILVKDASNQNRYLSFSSREKATNKPQLLLQTPAGTTSAIQQVVIEELMLPGSMTIYPNPAQSSINVRLPGGVSGKTFIEITDLMGRRKGYFTRVVDGGQQAVSIDLTSLSLLSGPYVLKVTTNNGSSASLFTVRRE